MQLAHSQSVALTRTRMQAHTLSHKHTRTLSRKHTLSSHCSSIQVPFLLRSLITFFFAAAAALLNGSCANSICRERERMGERGRAPVGTGIRVRDLSAGTNANKSLVNRTRVFLTFSTRVFISYSSDAAF